MAKDEPEGIRPHGGTADGWRARRAVASTVRDQMDARMDARALRRMKQPDGFDPDGGAPSYKSIPVILQGASA